MRVRHFALQSFVTCFSRVLQDAEAEAEAEPNFDLESVSYDGFL